MTPGLLARIARASTAFVAIAGAWTPACTQERPGARSADVGAERSPRDSVIESPKQLHMSPYRASLGRGAELFIPGGFTPRREGYDLVIHFHGAGKHQEANIEHAQLNVAVVSVNLGAGTDPYANAFRSPDAFERLLADSEAEIEKSGRANGIPRRRLALTAWSAGFVSIAKILSEPSAMQRVDAVLLADGFFTSFSDAKKRIINAQNLDKFVRLGEAAIKDEKLFAITHTTIPTGPYPSVQECVAKLLDLCAVPRTPSSTIGPRNMHEFYAVDRGSFHVHGYEGQLAGDHVKQLQAMGETLFPYLKARWSKQDEASSSKSGEAAPRSSP